MKMIGMTCLGVALFGVLYFNLPLFGHLPDQISMTKIKASPNYRDGHFVNLHDTPLMTGERGTLRTMYDFYFAEHPNKKPNRPISSLKTD